MKGYGHGALVVPALGLIVKIIFTLTIKIY